MKVIKVMTEHTFELGVNPSNGCFYITDIMPTLKKDKFFCQDQFSMANAITKCVMLGDISKETADILRKLDCNQEA